MCDYCAWIEKLLRPPAVESADMCTKIITEETKDHNVHKSPVKSDPTILVHGTASSGYSREEINETLGAIEEAAIQAYKELAKGCSSVDAIELAIRYLETEDSSSGIENNLSVVRNAALMSNDFNAGCVGAVIGDSHPISLAKKVLQETEHVLIVENGAQNLSDTTARENEEINKLKSREIRFDNEQASIRIYGAVARDRKSRLTCGVSSIDERVKSAEWLSMTAGATVLGCGIFSNNEDCCTVSGEDRALYVYGPARKIIKRLNRERAEIIKDTVDKIVETLNDELTNFIKEMGESCIGTSSLGIKGKPKVAFKSQYFPWACCYRGEITSGCINDEIFTRAVGDLDMPLDCECHSLNEIL